jgi:hypothetical protein
MNERIQEIAKQCWDQRLDGQLHFDTEQFAELILRECIDVLDGKIYNAIDHEGDEIWPDLILKEHFGVEE